MEYLYAWVLLFTIIISLIIIYNPLCLSKYGLERFEKDGDVGNYDAPW